MKSNENSQDRANHLGRLMMMLPKCSTSMLAGMADALEHDLIEAAATMADASVPAHLLIPDAEEVEPVGAPG